MRNYRGRPESNCPRSGVSSRGPETPRPQNRGVGWRGCLQTSGNRKPKPKPVSQLPPRRPRSASSGPRRPPRARLSSAMASCFCFGFCRAEWSLSRHHGPPGGRGAGQNGRGCGVTGEARGGTPKANLARFVCTCTGGSSARFTAGQLQRDASPRPPPAPSAWLSGTQLFGRRVDSQPVLGLNCCPATLWEQERREFPRNGAHRFLL